MESENPEDVDFFTLKDKIIATDQIIQIASEKDKQIKSINSNYKKILQRFTEKQNEFDLLYTNSKQFSEYCNKYHTSLEKEFNEKKEAYNILEKNYNDYINSSEIKFQTAYSEIEQEKIKYEVLLKKFEKLEKNVKSPTKTTNAKIKKIEKEIEEKNEILAELEEKILKLDLQHNNDLKHISELQIECTQLKTKLDTIKNKKFSKSKQNLHKKISELEAELSKKNSEIDIIKLSQDSTIEELTKKFEREKKLLSQELKSDNLVQLKKQFNKEKCALLNQITKLTEKNNTKPLLLNIETQTDLDSDSEISNFSEILTELSYLPRLLTPLPAIETVSIGIQTDCLKTTSVETNDKTSSKKQILNRSKRFKNRIRNIMINRFKQRIRNRNINRISNKNEPEKKNTSNKTEFVNKASSPIQTKCNYPDMNNSPWNLPTLVPPFCFMPPYSSMLPSNVFLPYYPNIYFPQNADNTNLQYINSFYPTDKKECQYSRCSSRNSVQRCNSCQSFHLPLSPHIYNSKRLQRSRSADNIRSDFDSVCGSNDSQFSKFSNKIQFKNNKCVSKNIHNRKPYNSFKHKKHLLKCKKDTMVPHYHNRTIFKYNKQHDDYDTDSSDENVTVEKLKNYSNSYQKTIKFNKLRNNKIHDTSEDEWTIPDEWKSKEKSSCATDFEILEKSDFSHDEIEYENQNNIRKQLKNLSNKKYENSNKSKSNKYSCNENTIIENNKCNLSNGNVKNKKHMEKNQQIMQNLCITKIHDSNVSLDKDKNNEIVTNTPKIITNGESDRPSKNSYHITESVSTLNINCGNKLITSEKENEILNSDNNQEIIYRNQRFSDGNNATYNLRSRNNGCGKNILHNVHEKKISKENKQIRIRSSMSSCSRSTKISTSSRSKSFTESLISTDDESHNDTSMNVNDIISKSMIAEKFCSSLSTNEEDIYIDKNVASINSDTPFKNILENDTKKQDSTNNLRDTLNNIDKQDISSMESICLDLQSKTIQSYSNEKTNKSLSQQQLTIQNDQNELQISNEKIDSEQTTNKITSNAILSNQICSRVNSNKSSDIDNYINKLRKNRGKIHAVQTNEINNKENDMLEILSIEDLKQNDIYDAIENSCGSSKYDLRCSLNENLNKRSSFANNVDFQKNSTTDIEEQNKKNYLQVKDKINLINCKLNEAIKSLTSLESSANESNSFEINKQILSPYLLNSKLDQKFMSYINEGVNSQIDIDNLNIFSNDNIVDVLNGYKENCITSNNAYNITNDDLTNENEKSEISQNCKSTCLTLQPQKRYSTRSSKKKHLQSPIVSATSVVNNYSKINHSTPKKSTKRPQNHMNKNETVNGDILNDSFNVSMDEFENYCGNNILQITESSDDEMHYCNLGFSKEEIDDKNIKRERLLLSELYKSLVMTITSTINICSDITDNARIKSQKFLKSLELNNITDCENHQKHNLRNTQNDCNDAIFDKDLSLDNICNEEHMTNSKSSEIFSNSINTSCNLNISSNLKDLSSSLPNVNDNTEEQHSKNFQTITDDLCEKPTSFQKRNDICLKRKINNQIHLSTKKIKLQKKLFGNNQNDLSNKKIKMHKDLFGSDTELDPLPMSECKMNSPILKPISLEENEKESDTIKNQNISKISSTPVDCDIVTHYKKKKRIAHSAKSVNKIKTNISKKKISLEYLIKRNNILENFNTSIFENDKIMHSPDTNNLLKKNEIKIIDSIETKIDNIINSSINNSETDSLQNYISTKLNGIKNSNISDLFTDNAYNMLELDLGNKIFKKPEKSKFKIIPSTPKSPDVIEYVYEEPKIIPLDPAKSLKLKIIRKHVEKIITKEITHEILDDCVKHLEKQNPLKVASVIVDEAIKDVTLELDKTYTPPAPQLNVVHQKLIILLDKLSNISNHEKIHECILKIARQKLLNEKRIEYVHCLTRFYIGVSMQKFDAEQIRILCVDSAYYMNDYFVPFLFIALTMYPEILPTSDHLKTNSLIVQCMPKALIQAVKMKNAAKPGYNLKNLNFLLTQHYGYEMIRANNDTLMEEFVKIYLETHSKIVFTAIIVLCKNVPNAWTFCQIKKYFMPIVNKNLHFKDSWEFVALTIRLITRIMQPLCYKMEDKNKVQEIRDWFSGFVEVESTLPIIIRTHVSEALTWIVTKSTNKKPIKPIIKRREPIKKKKRKIRKVKKNQENHKK